MAILPISNSVIDKAIRLRQQRRRSLGDSIIAATALLYNLPVLTNNVADFSTIDGLRVISLADVMNA
jgi:predicted nucleic acid-binding protein